MIFKIGQAELYKRKKRFLNTTKYIIWFNGELLNMFQSTSISNFKNTSAELPK